MILLYLLEKEFKQMMRLIILPIIFVLLPLFMLNVLPRIATQEVKNMNIVVVDNDHSGLSRRLTEKLSASAWFNLLDVPQNYAQAERHIKSGDADVVVEISRGFEKDLYREGKADVQVSANAINGSKSGLGTAYITQIITSYANELNEDSSALPLGSSKNSQQPTANSQISTRFLYNINLDYKVYMIPALIAMLLTLLIGFLPALNIVLEKEHGTIEQINVTPIRPMEFILSKLIPYWVVGIFLLFYSIFCGGMIHDVWPAGSIWSILAITSLFLLVASSLGLIVSNYSDTIQQAALVMFFFLIIFILLSGLLTPVSSMPAWAHYITEANPMRFFIEPIRIIYIKGATFADLKPYFLRLALMAVVSSALAIESYKKNS